VRRYFHGHRESISHNTAAPSHKALSCPRPLSELRSRCVMQHTAAIEWVRSSVSAHQATIPAEFDECISILAADVFETSHTLQLSAETAFQGIALVCSYLVAMIDGMPLRKVTKHGGIFLDLEIASLVALMTCSKESAPGVLDHVHRYLHARSCTRNVRRSWGLMMYSPYSC